MATKKVKVTGSEQDELQELLDSKPETASEVAKTETKPEAPAPTQDLPPDPRAAGTSATPRKPTEDKIVDEIAAENAHSALDDVYENEREPEGPMLILGAEKRHWYSFLKRPKFWWSLFGILILAALFAWLITPSRLWALNTIGLRTQLNVATLVSATEGTPPTLKNALVTVNGQDYHTDDEGKLTVTIPYGQTRIVITKQGYETITKDEMFDYDPFFYLAGGQQADEQLRNQAVFMKSVGVELTFIAKDWLSGQPITSGHFSVGDVVTTPGAKGEVHLVLPATDAKTVQVKAEFGGSGYADTTVEIGIPSNNQERTFVPAGKHYFISKRSGQFAVYSSNLDGTNVAEVVPAASSETADIAFTVSPSGKYGVLASTREATRDTFGSVQQKAYVIDFANNKMTAVDAAMQFDFADWSGDTVVYTARVHNESGEAVQRLASINAENAKQTTLATDANIKAVRVRLNNVLFMTNASELRVVKAGGGSEKSLGSQIAALTQPEPNKFVYQIADKSWRQYDVNADQVSTVATPAATDRAFLANTSADGQTLLAVEPVDGKQTLIAKSVGNGQETKLFSGELSGPVRWVGNVAVYRAGASDYAVASGGGTPKKITDVSATQSSPDDYFDFN
jgi:Tol biopolymer transport system component